jgi:Type II CAAX prenyl endopeptidase Rce1-like
VSHPATPDHNDPLWLIALELALFLPLFALVNTFVPGSLAVGTFPLPIRIFLYFAFAWVSRRRRGLAWRDLGLRRPEGWVISLLATNVVFGLAHAYQGPLGMVLAGASGTVAGLRYLRAAQPVAQHRDARGIPIPA